MTESVTAYKCFIFKSQNTYLPLSIEYVFNDTF